ncbi:hypothetical protein [Foetidibacter luteolus]|uniref:hypothetical protein n=1 Tax=Foetidibacter luteolus TaxID=2608880 RepID=UPI00129A2805|nr:hypothetical protein [Foetidibacter luteolus]
MYAQFNAGDKVLGGSFSLNASKNEQLPYVNSDFGINVSPSFAKFKTANTAVGFKILGQYSNAKTETPNSGYQKNRYWSAGAGVFGQRYFFIGSQFFVMGEAGFNASYNKGKVTYGESTYTNSSGFSGGFYLAPGFGIKLSKKFLLDLTLNNLAVITYHHSINKSVVAGADGGKSKVNNFSVSSNLNGNTLGNLGLGFRWLM